MRTKRRGAAAVVMGVALMSTSHGTALSAPLFTPHPSLCNGQSGFTVRIATPWKSVSGHIFRLPKTDREGRFIARIPIRALADIAHLSVVPHTVSLTNPAGGHITLTVFDITDDGYPVRSQGSYFKEVTVTATAIFSGRTARGGWPSTFVILESTL